VAATPDGLVLDGDGEPVSALRGLCGAAWRGAGKPAVSAASGPARAALAALGLA
jgi:hypothetical protein